MKEDFTGRAFWNSIFYFAAARGAVNVRNLWILGCPAQLAGG